MPERPCLNCGAPASGLYCPACVGVARTPMQRKRLEATSEAPPARVGGRFGSKTEERYFADRVQPRLLTGLSTTALIGQVKIRLADGCWYTPDVFELTASRVVWMQEVKGAHVRDDALVKFKVAAEHNRWARWTMVQWKDGAWRTLYDTDAPQQEG